MRPASLRIASLRPAVLVLAAALACVGGSAAAKDDEKPAAKAAAPAGPHLRYAKSVAEAMAEARDRGCVVFATYHGDG